MTLFVLCCAVASASQASIFLLITPVKYVPIGGYANDVIQIGGIPPSAAPVTLTYTVPPGTKYKSVTVNRDWQCSESSGVVTCTNPYPSASMLVIVSSTVPADMPAGTPVPMSGTVKSRYESQDFSQTPVAAPAPSGAMTSDVPPSFVAGSLFHAHFTVTNTDTVAHNYLALSSCCSEPLNGLTFVTASGTAGANCHANGNNWNCLASLSPGASATLELGIKSDPFQYTPSTTLTTVLFEDDFDVDVARTVSTYTSTTLVDAALTSTAPQSVAVGDNAVFTVIVMNSGPTGASSTIVWQPPPNATFVRSDCGAPKADGKITCTELLAPGVARRIGLTVRADSPGPITSTASVTATNPADSNSTNDTTTATTTAVTVASPSADLAVTMTPATPAVDPTSGLSSWNITVTNLGPSTVNRAVLKFFPPAGTTQLPSNSFLCDPFYNCDLGVLGALPAGRSVGGVITTQTPTSPGATLTARATVSGDITDPQPENNFVAASVVVNLKHQRAAGH